jgi:hypothetical protein
MQKRARARPHLADVSSLWHELTKKEKGSISGPQKTSGGVLLSQIIFSKGDRSFRQFRKTNLHGNLQILHHFSKLIHSIYPSAVFVAVLLNLYVCFPLKENQIPKRSLQEVLWYYEKASNTIEDAEAHERSPVPTVADVSSLWHELTKKTKGGISRGEKAPGALFFCNPSFLGRSLVQAAPQDHVA